MNKVQSIVMIVLGVVVTALPLSLLVFTGEAAHELDGELAYERPALNAADFLGGNFQKNFEDWFNTRHPLRAELIEIHGILDAGKDRINLAGLVTDELDDEPAGFRGTDQVIIGRNGRLFENSYINEFFGFSDRYTNVTDGELRERAAVLRNIQDELNVRGIVFGVVITPSKAAWMPQYIPAWYTARFVAPEGYVRPYERFVGFLEEYGVVFVDSSALYRETRLYNVFPVTGIHWTKPAALETSMAALSKYERQTGRTTRHFGVRGMISCSEPSGFGNCEQDIFRIVYAGRRNELENAITDDLYFWPDVYTGNPHLPPIAHMTIQGGSFADDIIHYFGEYGIAYEITRIRYNNGNNVDIWEDILAATSFILLEVNEQHIYNMGGNPPAFGLRDFREPNRGNNIIDALNYALNVLLNE